MNNIRDLHRRLLAAALLWVATAPAIGAETGTVAPVTPQTDLNSGGGQVRLQERFIRDFGAFAGSDANAQSLYTGLRTGTRISLTGATTTTSGGAATTPVVQFDAPTQPMGNGNVFISMALAKQQLANYGITNPTPQQLQAALTGGTIIPAGTNAQPVVMKGVLVQRADGMGWGSIAKASGMNLGTVVSGLRSGKPPATAGTATATSAGGSTSVTTAAGASASTRSDAGGQSLTANRGKSAYAASASGMVSAAGNPVGAGYNTHAQAGRAGSMGTSLTTAGGGFSGPGRSAASPQGQGKGLTRQ